VSYDPNARRDTELALRLKGEIARSGPIAVSDFVARCLWDEKSGYYATRGVIGAANDFITAAEISQVFGELIGLWSGVVWQQALGSPPAVSFVEYGPGRGTMMRDCLRAARVVPGFAAAVQVHMVEMSRTLEEMQKAALAESGVPARWSQSLVGFPTPAIILANEFLDAWPVDQWIMTQGGWRQRAIGIDGRGVLDFCATENGPLRSDLAQRFTGAPLGTIVEGQRLERFAEAFRALSRRGPVAALVIDYGYASVSAGDTLQAVRNHAYESPLTSPGEADISCHVNFFDLASALHGAGLVIDGPVTQGEFLGALGIVERASRLMSANPVRAGEIEMGVARLMAPGAMGSLFKVIGVRSQGLPALPGFPVPKEGP
jgi:NADH dehydrogenase [ubiquinone] 1 alpha subcomplex assembly factor 7